MWDFAGNDRAHCSRVPAGLVAPTVHFGPYANLGEAYVAIREWCDEHGHRLSSTLWEIYGHWQKSWDTDPSVIRTGVFDLLDD